MADGPFNRLLDGKRVLITGGSRGLGRAFCEYFRNQGARVAFTYSTVLPAGKGEDFLSYRVSVLDVPGLKAMVADLDAKWGGLDILVNNAGVSEALPLALMDEEDWDKVMDVNTKGLYCTSRAVIPGMIRRKQGVILNIGSLAGEHLIASPIHYAASKAAVRGFTAALSKELERYGIRVNNLAPGLLEEGVAQNLPDYKVEDYLKNVSLHRRGSLEEIAKLAAFLVSDRNSYMNGATLRADGGF
jgi:3-oxoacyl-[acyl-carrier protein] reductase